MTDTQTLPRWLRPALLFLAVPNLFAGIWAIVAPQSWYDNFPGWAPQLISAFPPFNEHLVTDAGSGLLTAGVLAGVAAAWPRRTVILTAMAGFLAFSVPHTLFHVFNPADDLTGSEDITNSATLGISVALALVVTWVTYQQEGEAA